MTGRADPTETHGGGARTHLHHDSVHQIGEVVAARYILTGSLGAGGMGEVRKCHDRRLGVDVTLKFVRHREDGSTSRGRELRNVVLSARRVTSPHVCRTDNLVAHGDTDALCMELFEGESLQDLLAAEPCLSQDEALDIASQLLDGLTAIHDAGLIHRDLKPSNIMRTPGGRVVIMDFGLALWTSDGHEHGVAGTPSYMSPEQAMGGRWTAIALRRGSRPTRAPAPTRPNARRPDECAGISRRRPANGVPAPSRPLLRLAENAWTPATSLTWRPGSMGWRAGP